MTISPIIWYAEQKNLFGKWVPTGFPTDPSKTTVVGPKRQLRNIHEVPEHLRTKDLNYLELYFNRKDEILPVASE